MKMKGENLMFEEIFEMKICGTTDVMLCVRDAQQAFLLWKDEIAGELP